ncbi:hypothetical protein BBC0244_000130 [Bartonella apihabitans]|nr:hypothetical protein BBC0244_000130 [Bartonella apihabitans]
MLPKINFGVPIPERPSRTDVPPLIAAFKLRPPESSGFHVRRILNLSGSRFNAHSFQKKPYRLFGMQLLKYMHILPKNRFTLFGMWLFKCTHILSKNRFTLFGMWLFKCTHILSKNRFTLFGMWLFKCTHILSKNRFTLFGMCVSHPSTHFHDQIIQPVNMANQFVTFLHRPHACRRSRHDNISRLQHK